MCDTNFIKLSYELKLCCIVKVDYASFFFGLPQKFRHAGLMAEMFSYSKSYHYSSSWCLKPRG